MLRAIQDADRRYENSCLYILDLCIRSPFSSDTAMQLH
jgi:hypothetical protein